MYCPGCKAASVFVPQKQDSILKRAADSFPRDRYGADVVASKAPTFFSVEFTCSRSREHVATFAFMDSEGLLTKIGEYPSTFDRLALETRRYQKKLGPLTDEFRRSIQLYSHGLGVGSFVYLRRVLERVVEEVARRKFGNQQDWTYEKWRNNRKFEELVHELEDALPELLIENSLPFRVLSKGIHDLDEDECLAYYEVLRQSVEEILDDQMRKDESESRRKSISAKLSGIGSSIKRKK